MWRMGRRTRWNTVFKWEYYTTWRRHCFRFNKRYLLLTEEKTTDQLEGSIWIYPLGKELELDLSKKYEKPFTVCTNKTSVKPFILSVSDLQKDIKIKFEYKAAYKNENFEVKDLSNPFTVCEEIDEEEYECSPEIKDFDFKKGKSYKINVDFEEKNIEELGEKYNFLPGFTISEANASIIKVSLISLALLLLI